MSDNAVTLRTFPFRMADWLPGCYAGYLLWLRCLVERLGREGALGLWREAYQDYDDVLLSQILSLGWSETPQDKTPEVEQAVEAALARYFPVEIAGVPRQEAGQLVASAPPIRQIRQEFDHLNVWKEMTAYQALHMRFDGLARLVEELKRRFDKQGELVAYDILRADRRRASGGRTGSVAQFMAEFIAEPREANLFTAGLETVLVRAGEQEVVLHVRVCEWARYFQERHPRVGYLMACSTDETAFQAFNPNLRLQRTQTLMEGGALCDFRIYAMEGVESV